MASSDAVPELVVVCDAGPLIHLDEMGCIDLLNDFSRVLVPDAVWCEVKRHRPDALLNPEDTFERIISTGIEPPTLQALARSLSLHGGERAALAVAFENQATMLLTDDAAARLAAGSLGIPCHGSLGILGVQKGSVENGTVLSNISDAGSDFSDS